MSGVRKATLFRPALGHVKLLSSIGTVAKDVREQEIKWLWWPLIPMGGLTILTSNGGVGKGLMVSDLVSRITRGDTWPMTDERASIGNVIWAEAEDPADSVLVPRLQAANTDQRRVVFVTRDQFGKLTRRDIVDQDIRLIVLSPMQSFLEVKNINDDGEVRDALGDIQRKIKGTRCAVLGIMHPNKKADLSALERMLGSQAFRNFVRSVVLLRVEEGSEDTVRMIHGKWNWGIKQRDMLFVKEHKRPDTPRSQHVGIDWKAAEFDIEVDKAFAPPKPIDMMGAPEWLVSYLRGKDEVDTPTIFAEGEKRGHSRRTLIEARNRSGRIHSKKAPGGKHYLWKLSA